MKKTFILILISVIAALLLAAVLFFFPKNNSERQPITITTANGENASKYQNLDEIIADQDSQNGMPQTILGGNTSVAHGEENNVYAFCGNKNSKIYHKLSCSSVKKTKEENKIYFKTLEECQNSGYKPCKMCSE